MRESQRGHNPTLARLAREARRAGVAIRPVKARQPGAECVDGSAFEFTSASQHRLWRFKGAGKGTVRVLAFIACEPEDNDGNPWVLDANTVVGIARATDIIHHVVVVGCIVCGDATGIRCCEFGSEV